MKLSLTPINEAWQLQKVKKSKSTNRYTKPDTQIQLLQEVNQKTNSPAYVPVPGEFATSNSTLEYQNDVEKHEDVSEVINVTLTDVNALRILKPYKEEYINKMINDLVITHLVDKGMNSEIVETFTNDNTNSDTTYLAITIALLILCALIQD